MNGKLLKTALLVGVLTLAAGAGQAWAQSAGTTFVVRATVNPSCTILATDLTFDTVYNPLTTGAIDDDSTITVRCTKGTTAQIGLAGTGLLTSGAGDTLSYVLYKDAARTQLWGANGADRLQYVAENRSPYDFVVFGRLLGTEDAPAGAYQETVTATIYF